MATMTLQAVGVNGGVAYSFPHDPKGTARVRKRKAVSAVRTLESSGSYSWGFKSEQSGLQGIKRVLTWSYLPGTVYDMLRLFYETSNDVAWNPQSKAHTGSATYKVKLMRLSASHITNVAGYYKDVELELEIQAVL